MDSKCLRLLRISSPTIFMGGLLLYRKGAGCCSIIVMRAFPDALEQIIDNARVFFMPVHNHSWGLYSTLRKISCWIFQPYL